MNPFYYKYIKYKSKYLQLLNLEQQKLTGGQRVGIVLKSNNKNLICTQFYPIFKNYELNTDTSSQNMGNTGPRTVFPGPGSLGEQYYGLPNIGSTCYLNATLQFIFTLIQIQNLTNNIQNSQLKQFFHEGRRKQRLIRELNIIIDIIQQYIGSDTSNIIIKSCKQEDASEIFIQIYNKILLNNTNENMNITLINNHQCSKCNYKVRTEHLNESPIIMCNISNKSSPFYITHALTTQKGIIKYNDAQAHNMPNCNTNEFISFNSYVLSNPPPPYLIFHIVRFEKRGSETNKLNNTIKFQENIPDIFDIIINNFFYELTSFIAHAGVLNSGHYVNYSKINNTWWKFNDTTVDQVNNITTIDTSRIYMLLYKENDKCINTKIQRLKLCPFGVLGINKKESIKLTSSLDFQKIIVVDPAGLDINIKGTLFQAREASGEIYEWVKEVDTSRNTFPLDVQKNIKKDGDAVYYEYALNRHIIHVVGPCADTRYKDYYKPEYAQETNFTDILTKAYTNVLDVFISISDYKSFTLHLLPISGGAFAGRHKNKISNITFGILTKLLGADKYKDINIRFCMFTQKEYDQFRHEFVPL